MVAQELEVQEKKELAADDEKTEAGKYYLPYTDIHESAEAIIVAMDMPGVDKEHLDIELENNILTVIGRVSFTRYESLTPVYTEYNIGNYTRRFTVSNAIDTDAISAKIENGVLTVNLPKAKEAVAKRIEVR